MDLSDFVSEGLFRILLIKFNKGEKCIGNTHTTQSKIRSLVSLSINNLLSFNPWVFGIFLDPLLQSFCSSTGIDVLRASRLVLAPPFQCWEALDVNAWNLITCAIDLSNNDVWVANEL